MIADLLFSFGCGLDIAGGILLAGSSFVRPAQRVAVSGEFWGGNWYARSKAIQAVVEARAGLVALFFGFAIQFFVGLWSLGHNESLTSGRVLIDVVVLLVGVGVGYAAFLLTRDYFSRKVALNTAWYVSPHDGMSKKLKHPSATQLAFYSLLANDERNEGEEFLDYVKRHWKLNNVTDDIDQFGVGPSLATLSRAQLGVDLDDPENPAKMVD